MSFNNSDKQQPFTRTTAAPSGSKMKEV